MSNGGVMLNRGWLIVLACAGCLDADLETGFRSSAVNTIPDCDDPLICHGNSDLLARLGPYEVDETGKQFSPSGFRLKAVSKPGETIGQFHVEGTMVVARTKDGKWLSGDDIVGLTIDLEHVRGRTF